LVDSFSISDLIYQGRAKDARQIALYQLSLPTPLIRKEFTDLVKLPALMVESLLGEIAVKSNYGNAEQKGWQLKLPPDDHFIERYL